MAGKATKASKTKKDTKARPSDKAVARTSPALEKKAKPAEKTARAESKPVAAPPQ